MPLDEIIPQDLPGLEPKTRSEMQRLFGHIYELANGIDSIRQQLKSLAGGAPISAAQARDILAGLVPPLIGGTQDPLLSEVGTSTTSGTLTSVATLTDGSANGFLLSGGPITGAGTISFSISSAAAARDSLGLSTDTGWAAWTGVATKSSKATGAATTQDCAEAIKAIFDLLLAKDLIGA